MCQISIVRFKEPNRGWDQKFKGVPKVRTCPSPKSKLDERPGGACKQEPSEPPASRYHQPTEDFLRAECLTTILAATPTPSADGADNSRRSSRRRRQAHSKCASSRPRLLPRRSQGYRSRTPRTPSQRAHRGADQKGMSLPAPTPTGTAGASSPPTTGTS